MRVERAVRQVASVAGDLQCPTKAVAVPFRRRTVQLGVSELAYCIMDMLFSVSWMWLRDMAVALHCTPLRHRVASNVFRGGGSRPRLVM